MTILQIDTYDRNIFEATAMFNAESLNDRAEFSTLPQHIADEVKAHMAAGKFPTEKQPTDAFVVTDEHVIVTITWLDAETAQQHVAAKLTKNIMGLISSVVVVSD
jgi:hypothetical protein